MSKPDKTLDPKILDAAKKEFLEKGYEKASTNAICKSAGVTWGALQKRYSAFLCVGRTCCRGIQSDPDWKQRGFSRPDEGTAGSRGPARRSGRKSFCGLYLRAFRCIPASSVLCGRLVL